jgi:hypothetical protein
MSTLAELAVLHARGTNEANLLLDRVRAAVLVVAEGIRVEATSVANHTERLVWARDAFIDPRARAEELWGAILGANSTFSIAQITGASDAAIIDAVNSTVDSFSVLPAA